MGLSFYIMLWSNALLKTSEQINRDTGHHLCRIQLINNIFSVKKMYSTSKNNQNILLSYIL